MRELGIERGFVLSENVETGFLHPWDGSRCGPLKIEQEKEQGICLPENYRADAVCRDRKFRFLAIGSVLRLTPRLSLSSASNFPLIHPILRIPPRVLRHRILKREYEKFAKFSSLEGKKVPSKTRRLIFKFNLKPGCEN